MTKVHSDFKVFSPKNYLNEYYKNIGSENQALLQFLSKNYKTIFSELDFAEVIEIGGGPTIYQLISLSQYNVDIHFSEYSPKNRKELEKWLSKHPKRFGWRKYFNFVHHLENESNLPTPQHRETELRKKLKSIQHIDIKNTSSNEFGKKFDIVSCHFVAESITPHFDQWQNHISNIVSFVKPGGRLLLGSIIGSNNYKVKSKKFHATPLDADIITSELEKHGVSLIDDMFIPAEDPDQGYKGLHILHGRKLAK